MAFMVFAKKCCISVALVRIRNFEGMEEVLHGAKNVLLKQESEEVSTKTADISTG